MIDLRPCSLEEVRSLCEKFHGYKSAGGVAVYSFGVYESERLVAAYAWQPPPPGAARAVCPEAPQGVLSLSRMVAVPRDERALKHVSKPLAMQMKLRLDRSRWPVLVTYSDEGQGHTGYVYKCSGWTPTSRASRPVYENEAGERVSLYANGASGMRGFSRVSITMLQRWEHWACARGDAALWMSQNGWHRVPVPGRKWRSGNQAHTWLRK